PEVSVSRQVTSHISDILTTAFSRKLGVINTGDSKGIVRIWDFQLLTVLCGCTFSTDSPFEIMSLLFLVLSRLLSDGDSECRIVVVSIYSITRQMSVVAHAEPNVSHETIPCEQLRKFESESQRAGQHRGVHRCVSEMA